MNRAGSRLPASGFRQRHRFWSRASREPEVWSPKPLWEQPVRRAFLVVVVLLGFSTSVTAQQGEARKERAGAQVGKLLVGAAVGLVLHEAGHVAGAWAFDADPGVKRVEFSGIPFFAITHRSDLSPRREFVVSSAGFWSQYLLSEQILTHRPRLRLEQRPIEKGVVAFHVGTSVMYAAAAFAKIGPAERDTRGMASALGINERWIGALVLAPAILDAYRYFHPDAKWAAWSSRGVKIGMAMLVIK